MLVQFAPCITWPHLTPQSKNTVQSGLPQATLAPDWDVTEQIHETLVQFPSPSSYEWIQDHYRGRRNIMYKPIGLQLTTMCNSAARNTCTRPYFPQRLVHYRSVPPPTLLGITSKKSCDAYCFPILRQHLQTNTDGHHN